MDIGIINKPILLRNGDENNRLASVIQSSTTENQQQPWIERLIQNYDSEQRITTVRAHVVGVSFLTESQRTYLSNICVMFLSDGTVFIPAVLSTAGWEYMQELEERDSFSSLDSTTVSVQKFQLSFHMDPVLTSCQFYLTVNQLVTVSHGHQHHRPPSCTILQSVRNQIRKMWCSLLEGKSVPSVLSQSVFPLSCLMGAWHNDIITDLLNDMIKKLAKARTAGGLGMDTPTHWHRERLRCEAEECFSIPVSHLLIPEEQRKMLTADPGVSSSTKTPSCPMPCHVAEMTERPIAAQDRGGDSSSAASDRLEYKQQLDLNNTGAGLSEVRCGGGAGGGGRGREGGEEENTEMETTAQERESKTRESPWDNYPQPADEFANLSSFTEIAESRINVPPFQRPRLAPCSSTHQSGLITTSQEPQTASSLTPEHTATVCVEPSLTDMPQKIPQRVSHTKPAKKSRSQVHSDGSSFSYMYEPYPNVALALSQWKVPEHLVQWAVSYLGTSQDPLPVSCQQCSEAEKGCEEEMIIV